MCLKKFKLKNRKWGCWGLYALLFLGIVGFINPANAFKADTHIYVGQQVLNDLLDNGSLTIGGKEYAVDPEIVEALQRFPNEYRFGNIGPDASPDMLIGQMLIHPGIEGGWNTDDFLRWMLTGATSE
ncbi:MAG: hypothetical protein HQK78_11760, partial [Desulfobacterales bacterium]|nr:hypothetical protein [Desulfobacterales bacterium]